MRMSITQLILLFSGKICCGLGSAASALHRDLYKCAKTALTDRSQIGKCVCLHILFNN